MGGALLGLDQNVAHKLNRSAGQSLVLGGPADFFGIPHVADWLCTTIN